MIRYKVAYLIRARRNWANPIFESTERATTYMRALKRRGLTAWVEDEHGNFIPTVGAKKLPGFLED